MSTPQSVNSAGGSNLPFGPEHTPFEALGGDAAVRALVDAFYDLMHRNAQFAKIRELHKPELTEARQKLYGFLCGWLGGPQLYVEKYGHPRLRGRHMPFALGEIQRDQWLACMACAMDARGIGGDIRAFLDARFRHVADFLRNQDG